MTAQVLYSRINPDIPDPYGEIPGDLVSLVFSDERHARERANVICADPNTEGTVSVYVHDGATGKRVAHYQWGRSWADGMDGAAREQMVFDDRKPQIRWLFGKQVSPT